MEGPDQYRTLRRAVLAEPPKTKGSRFIGEAFPARTEEQAQAHLDAVRKREHAATHHCWAWRLTPDGSLFRYSDDGEPNGSAGAPIHRQIEGHGLTDVVVVVTRYYGGTKLGTGGLVRAYGDAAADALALAERDGLVVTKTVRVPVEVAYAHADTGAAMQTLARFDALLQDPAYDAEGARVVAAVRASEVADLEAAWTEALAGRGTLTRR